MNWGPKDWSWPPRLAKGFGWLRRTIARAQVSAVSKAIGEWLPEHYFSLIAAICIFLLPAWIWLIVEILGEVFTLTEGSNAGRAADERRNIAYALGVNITALAALLAAPLIIVRAWINERQAVVAARQAETAEQGLITDRFTKAVEQLGAEKTVKRREFKQRYKKHREKTGGEDRLKRDKDGDPIPATRVGGEPLGDWEAIEETVPNLEVRLGAIYALERIAQDSERDHIPIMETLCAYIRENAPASNAKDHGLGDWPDWLEDADDDAHDERNTALEARSEDLRKWATALPAPRVDVQAALSVIGRRGEERIAHERRQRRDDRDDDPGFRLDLRGANLQNADLMRARLDHALLTGARLEGAKLWDARLEGAHLSGARLEGADLQEAWLEGANLSGAQLEGADLAGARLERAHLGEARLEGADLTRARLQRANLREARLEGTDLREARLEGTNLQGARLEGANFQRARLEGANLAEARLERAHLMEARLEGANLRRARLEGAHLELADLHSAILISTNLRGWTCARTSLRSADFTDAKGLTQDHVNAAFGDSATVLPEGIVMPDHWDDETIEYFDNDEKYKAWLDAGAPAGKPRPDSA